MEKRKKTKWTGDHISVAIAMGFALGTAFGVILKATAHPDWETWHLAILFPVFIFSLHGLWFQIKGRLKRKSKKD